MAREGVTLLKNEAGLLPLDRAKVQRVAVLGLDADAYVGGGGSSYTKPARPVTLLEGLKAAAPDVQFDLIPYHGNSARNLSRMARASAYDGTLTATFYAGRDLAGEPLLTRQDKNIDFRWRGKPARAGAARQLLRPVDRQDHAQGDRQGPVRRQQRRRVAGEAGRQDDHRRLVRPHGPRDQRQRDPDGRAGRTT